MFWDGHLLVAYHSDGIPFFAFFGIHGFPFGCWSHWSRLPTVCMAFAWLFWCFLQVPMILRWCSRYQELGTAWHRVSGSVAEWLWKFSRQQFFRHASQGNPKETPSSFIGRNLDLFKGFKGKETFPERLAELHTWHFFAAWLRAWGTKNVDFVDILSKQRFILIYIINRSATSQSSHHYDKNIGFGWFWHISAVFQISVSRHEFVKAAEIGTEQGVPDSCRWGCCGYEKQIFTSLCIHIHTYR